MPIASSTLNWLSGVPISSRQLRIPPEQSSGQGSIERGRSALQLPGVKPGDEFMKVVIVGGVAGGASCAARLRRLDENAQILMVERGPYVPGTPIADLPDHIGGVIEKESRLLVASEATFREQFAVDCRTNCEAIQISPDEHTVQLRNVTPVKVTRQPYDKLGAIPWSCVASPAAARYRPTGNFRSEDRARRQGDLRVDRERLRVPHRNGQVRGLPDGEAQDARGGRRRRIHRPRDRGKPRPSRVRRDHCRDG